MRHRAGINYLDRVEEGILINAQHTFKRIAAPYIKTFGLALTLSLALVGCGGGSGSSGGNNGGGGGGGGNQNPFFSIVTGTVTDITGSAIIGAVVNLDGQNVNTTQFGAFQVPGVEVAAGETSFITTVTASRTINGNVWSGQNTVEVLRGDDFTRNVQIVLSRQSAQGSITGTVRDTTGRPLIGVQVFVGLPNQANAADFDNLASFTAFTNGSGNYTIPRLPPANRYIVTASFAGHLNRSSQNVVVASGQATRVDLNLPASTVQPNQPIVANFSAISITTPSVPTRAAGTPDSARGHEAIKQWIREKYGFNKRRASDPNRVIARQVRSRVTPAGSIIENDLFWDYVALENLLGYIILRSDNTDTSFRTIALQRDPLGERFADVDDLLTPDLNYYYSVARLDTIRFPADGTEGDPGPVVVVQPLGPISLQQPPSGAVRARPNFFWTLVNRATLYQILVYDEFPDYQSDTAADGVRPIWPADLNNPGTSLVDVRNGSRNNQLYDGPALQSGRTYYWAVLALDEVGSAFTISPIQSFVAQ